METSQQSDSAPESEEEEGLKEEEEEEETPATDSAFDEFQLHMLTQQLKISKDTINYQDSTKQMQSLRFIRLSVQLIPFTSATAHPGNFEVLFSSSGTVFGLICMIEDRIGIHSSRLEVFRSRVPTEEARLPPESSLEECGFKGGPEESPPEATVYYDYRLPFTDCPILNCDHYLTKH